MKVKHIIIPQLEYDDRGLTEGQEYVVVCIQGGHIRVIDDDLEPILYPAGYFRVVDEWIPSSWSCKGDPWGDDGSLGPTEFDVPGFFEKYFDHDTKIIQRYKKVVERDYGELK